MLSLKNNQITDIAPLESLGELRFLFLEGNKIANIAPIYQAMKKDLDGSHEYAPYLNLYLTGNPLDEASKKIVDEMKAQHLRVTP